MDIAAGVKIHTRQAVSFQSLVQIQGINLEHRASGHFHRARCIYIELELHLVVSGGL